MMTNTGLLGYQEGSVGGCCGTFVLFDFYRRRLEGPPTLSTTGYSWEEVCADFEGRLKRTLKSRFHNRGMYEGYQLGMINLVSHYPSLGYGQYPEFQQHLLSSGWKISHQWVNSNTENVVTQYTKLFDSKDFPIDGEDEEDEEDECWEEDFEEYHPIDDDDEEE